VLEKLTGSSDLSAAGENRSHKEGIRGHSLHSQFAGTPAARAADPHDAVLRLIISHANVQNFSAANFPAQPLENQTTAAHIDNDGGIHKSLAMGIKPPDLYR
jgi:hypothetical protein